MTATIPVVDDPLVPAIARQLAQEHFEEWGVSEDACGGGWVAMETERLTPHVRQTIEALQKLRRLLPEGASTDALLVQQWGTRVAGGHVIEWPDEEVARAQTANRRALGREAALVHRWHMPAETTVWQATT